MFESISKLDGIITALPTVIARLQSLQRISEAGAAFLDDTQKIEAQQAEIGSLLTSQQASVTRVGHHLIPFLLLS